MAKKKLRKVFILILALLLLAASYFIYFLYSTNAPIKNGKVTFHIKYNGTQEMDIYHPTKQVEGNVPVVLFIHGGAWIGGSRAAINMDRINGAVNILRSNGFMVASADYTLAEDNITPFPECIHDGFEAIRWLKENSDSLHIDMSKLYLIGESAGGHIAMLNTFCKPSDFGLKFNKIPVKGLVNIYGPNDLWHLYHSGTSVKVRELVNTLPEIIKAEFDLPKILFGFDPEEDSLRTVAFTNRYSPLRYLDVNAPPVLSIHGDKDQIVPVQQTYNLKNRLDSMKIENEIKILKGVDHAFRGATDAQKDSVQKWIANFILNLEDSN